LSNHAYGHLESDPIPVTPNTQYTLSAWTRGKIDPDDSYGLWLIRAYYYDAGGAYLSYQDSASGDGTTTSETWHIEAGA
jgi:hypothetical protein